MAIEKCSGDPSSCKLSSKEGYGIFYCAAPWAALGDRCIFTLNENEFKNLCAGIAAKV
jgi:hypothetical protein